MSRNKKNFISNKYFTTKKNLKIFKYSQPENYPLKVYETAPTGLATIMGKISIFSKNQGCGSLLIFPDPDPEFDVGDQYGSGSNTDPGL